MENTDPLPTSQYVVGLAYNLRKGIQSDVEDIEAEYDSIETVDAIKKALEELGCKVVLLEADEGIFEKLMKNRVDIVFNIAEGIYGRGREAQVPAILNYMKIPFTGSDETSLCISLDKALSKRLLATYRIKTPRYQLVVDNTTRISKTLRYPLIVKPNAEGSSKGISEVSVVHDYHQLEQTVDRNYRLYNQPVLVEEFIAGREFTVAVVNNGSETMVFPPMEIIYRNSKDRYGIYSYNVKKNYKEYIEYACPAEIDAKTSKKMMEMAKRIFSILECRDFSRIDFRLSGQGEIYFIEINPLPGLAPGYSDYPMIAEFMGIDYTSIVKMILNSALKRHGMIPVA